MWQSKVGDPGGDIGVGDLGEGDHGRGDHDGICGGSGRDQGKNHDGVEEGMAAEIIVEIVVEEE